VALWPWLGVLRSAWPRTLDAIASGGREPFYLGRFGDGLVELGDGLFAPEDLARSQADWVTPLRVTAWGHDVWTTPPPSQGYLTLAGAWISDGLPLPEDPDDPAWPHLLAEAARVAGADRCAVLFDGTDGAALLARERVAPRRAGIHPRHPGEHAHPTP